MLRIFCAYYCNSDSFYRYLGSGDRVLRFPQPQEKFNHLYLDLHHRLNLVSHHAHWFASPLPQCWRHRWSGTLALETGNMLAVIS